MIFYYILNVLYHNDTTVITIVIVQHDNIYNIPNNT